MRIRFEELPTKRTIMTMDAAFSLAGSYHLVWPMKRQEWGNKRSAVQIGFRCSGIGLVLVS